ncbi:hypothetical protein [Luteimonas sp. MC1750]|uniref:hypothetical protein n=1 Tax=Luteimonas sp. MC1750 TaxID=2799326 RepID=UPI0018F07C18|nr:hypothetical protein [Luteimonas sp. MC1750]MBJ6984224.1 hypothetical protein [Luteimonas sp. MC1750]QQO06989.1 hypothetical protein JGR68_06120 [Luteimonas sp. MC1750]
MHSSQERLWFEVSEEHLIHMSVECGDAFFVALVLMAHLRSQDISFTTPVSARLYYGVTEVLLPALRILSPNLPAISVVAETRDFHFTPTESGTALSLGVDSFHAIASSLDGPFPVTSLTLFNSGAFGDYGGDESRSLFWRTAENVAEAASEMGLPLILIDSNISEILQVSFVRTHSIRNLSFALLLPRLFSKFYYASGYPVSEFRLDASVVAATHYDLLMSKALCTETLEVMIAGLHDDRIDKIASISTFPPALHHLNVCVIAESNQFLDQSLSSVRNCSRCFKCVKTMVALDALGLLDSYSQVFDLVLYRSERTSNLGRILYDAMKLKSAHAMEIVSEGKNRPGFIPPQAYGYAAMRGFRNLLRKLQRDGRTPP